MCLTGSRLVAFDLAGVILFTKEKRLLSTNACGIYTCETVNFTIPRLWPDIDFESTDLLFRLEYMNTCLD